MTTIILLLFLCFFVGFSAILSAAETSLFSLSPLAIRSYQQDKDHRKRLIFHLLQKPRDLMVTILMLNIFANIFIQNVVSTLFSFSASWLVKVGLPLIIVLFFGEIIPKSVAFVRNYRVAYRLSPFISHAYRFLKPIHLLITFITSYISRFFFFFLKKEKPLSIEELKHILLTSHKTQVLNQSETKLLSGYLELYEGSIKEQMRPKEEIFYYDIQKPLENLILLFTEKKVSRLPVCNKNLDHLLGIITLENFLMYKNNIRSAEDVKRYLKKPYYVPMTTNCLQVLLEMRQRRESLAIIVDEYGALQGLISDEDLVEEVIGEIQDQKDQQALYTRSSDNVIIASGRLELDIFEEIFSVVLMNKTNAITLGGWLIEQLGDIPQTGTKYITDDFFFYILAAKPHRIQRIYVRKLKPLKRYVE